MSFKFCITFLSMISLSSTLPDERPKVPDYGGEIISYNLSYGIFHIGNAKVTFLDDSLGYGAYIKAEAKSTGVARFLKSIDYSFESCMDTSTGLPKSSIIRLKDRRRLVYNETVFDQQSRKDSSIVQSQLSGQHIVPKNTYDLLTAYFCFRKNHITQSVKPEHETIIKIYITDILWDLKIKYLGMETIKTMYGKIECLKYCPSTVAGNYFKNEDDMTIWFTDDIYHTPVKARMDLTLGSINFNMVDYQKPQ